MTNQRRTFLGATAASVLAVAACSTKSMDKYKLAPASQRKTFVLAHGSWHGGWCWSRVAEQLRAFGHTVATPSYTGMGDRVHLLSKSITIETFVDDLVNVIEQNEYQDVILVGHSFGGVPITGVADRIPGKLRHLVYLDSLILESGKNSFSMYPPEEAAARISAAERASSGVAVPPPDKLPQFWGLTEGSSDYQWVARRLTPQPLRSYTTALDLKGPIGNGIPRTYVECTQPQHPVLAASRELVRSQAGWNRLALAAPHDAMITHPADVSKLLLTV